jgi:hypothetical protein
MVGTLPEVAEVVNLLYSSNKHEYFPTTMPEWNQTRTEDDCQPPEFFVRQMSGENGCWGSFYIAEVLDTEVVHPSGVEPETC